MESIDQRKKSLERWLKEKDCVYHLLEPLTPNASFRRYYRLHTATGTLIAVDAPPQHENVLAFLSMAQFLTSLKLTVPQIIAADTHEGFLLVSDLGEATFLATLTAENADHLYAKAMDSLLTMQLATPFAPESFPHFTAEWMWQEWVGHKKWFLRDFLTLQRFDETVLDDMMLKLIHSALNQPQVMMHRDYHAANLMWMDDHVVGLLDFQDAMLGPMTYDLVSLLRDCYVSWPAEKVNQWMAHYTQKIAASPLASSLKSADFKKWFDWMGLQRHLKALFTFSRKILRDQQADYLSAMPRTLNYVVTVSADYKELAELYRFYAHIVSPELKRTVVRCEA